MTKKDYKVLAEVVGKFLACQDIPTFLADLEDLFSRNNPRFNCDRWREAVGEACQRWAQILSKR